MPDSVQFQTVLALYDQETVRLHIDQTVRTRNFRVQNEIAERGAVTKSQNGRKGYVERKVGDCYQWKAHGQCLKGDSCSFSYDPASGNGCEAQRRKGPSSSPAPNSNVQAERYPPKVHEKDDRLLPHPIRSQNGLTARSKNPHRGQAINRATRETTVKFHADSNSVKIRHVIVGTLPCVKITSLRQDAYMATNAVSDMLRRRKSPARRQRKVVRMDQLLC